QGPVSDQELSTGINLCTTMHQMNLETTAAQAFSDTVNESLGLGYDWDNKYNEMIKKVTKEDISRVARKYFGHHLIVETVPQTDRKPK
ncbi:MAG: hypothetical protein HQK58_14350, partial [Deltaproteobacteria bacterium]|nr:hypothetical protein [Deltaproteobacteria bacterium]